MKKHLSTLVRLAFLVVLVAFAPGFSKEPTFAESFPNHHATRIIIPMYSVSPNGTTTGNCGEIEFYVDNDGNGDADFPMLVSSFYGPITSLTYSWSWFNWNTEKGQNYGDTIDPGSSRWEQDPEYHVGTGLVGGSISATDVTAGQECEGSESDSNTIT